MKITFTHSQSYNLEVLQTLSVFLIAHRMALCSSTIRLISELYYDSSVTSLLLFVVQNRQNRIESLLRLQNSNDACFSRLYFYHIDLLLWHEPWQKCSEKMDVWVPYDCGHWSIHSRCFDMEPSSEMWIMNHQASCPLFQSRRYNPTDYILNRNYYSAIHDLRS